MKVVLGEVCKARSSLVDPTLAEYRVLPHVAPDSIERDTGRLLGYRSAAEDRVTSGKYRFEPGDVLYSKIRPMLNKVTRVAFAGLCSADMYALDVDSRRASPDFITHVLRGQPFLDYAISLSNRASIPKLNRNQLMRFEFELPPIADQRRIAAILDQADAIRAKRRQVLAHLDTLTQSIFRHMFGDLAVVRWDRVPLGDLVFKIDSGTSPVCEARPADDDEWGILKLGAVTYGVFQPAENKAFLGDVGAMVANEVQPGDVLMTRKNTRELVGAVAVVDEVRPRLLLPDLIFRLQMDRARIEPWFFQALMMNERKRLAVRNLSSGSAASMPNISKARLGGLPIELPPVERQREFSRRVKAASTVRAVAGMDSLDDLVASLQARAFRGEL